MLELAKRKPLNHCNRVTRISVVYQLKLKFHLTQPYRICAWNFCSIIVVGAARLRCVAPIIEGSEIPGINDDQKYGKMAKIGEKSF